MKVIKFLATILRLEIAWSITFFVIAEGVASWVWALAYLIEEPLHCSFMALFMEMLNCTGIFALMILPVVITLLILSIDYNL